MEEFKWRIQERILKSLEDYEKEVSSSPITLVCGNGKFKVNPVLVAGIYYLFELILVKLTDDQNSLISFPDICIEELESSIFSLYQQHNENPISGSLLRIIENNVKPKKDTDSFNNDIPDVLNEIIDKKENAALDNKLQSSDDDDPVTIKIVKKSIPRKKLKKDREKVACELCGKQVRNLKAHMEVHASPSYSVRVKVACNICGKLVQKQCMKQHMRNLHDFADQFAAKVSCHICGKVCMTKSILTSHLLVHEEKRPCPICGLAVRHLDYHMKSAHLSDDQKKHKCPDCGKGFYQSTKLTQHRINVHLRNRPFQCRYGCDIKYNDSSNRNSHERKKHGGLFNKLPP